MRVMQDVSIEEGLAGLTEPQREAATHVDGPLLVLAGPGSGKTRVITHRCAYLVKGVGIPPWQVLAITFTNKAAGEMRERVGNLVDARDARKMTVATFHSLCARLLRTYAERLGLPAGYSIYDTGDQKAAIKQALNDLEISTKNFPPASMLAAISNAKNQLQDAPAFASQASDFYARTVAKVYSKYQKTLERNGAVDFDDLLMKTVELFRTHPDVAAELRERFQYVLIDEYQDTNRAQFMIASALAPAGGERRNIMATGDPDQSIYGWRGADISNILDFESHYPDAKVVRLEQNYRSTQSILSVADALIRNNEQRKHKRLWTDNPDGEKVHVVTLRDERHEAEWVVEKLKHHHDEDGVAWGSMAVFYRINSLSRVLEDELRSAGIPYQIARGTAFYDRKEIKDTVAYLRAVANPADEVNLFRIINTPARGISKNTVEAIQAKALADGRPVDEVLAEPMKLSHINSRAQNAVARFNTLLDNWRSAAGMLPGSLVASGMTLRSLVEDVIRESGLHAFYQNDKSDPDQERLANLGEFVTFTQQFEEDLMVEAELDDAEPPSLGEKLLSLLERISLVSDVDAVEDGDGMVTLMTLHAAKGLEFPVVAMTGVEDGLLPHERSLREGREVEEERRLAFVGITRAEQHLYLTHANYRTVFGQSAPTVPSRFLRELPSADVHVLDESDALEDFLGGGAASLGAAQRGRADRGAAAFPPGSLVRHARFGLGRVVEIGSMGTQTRVKVNFNAAGPKTLVLEYAKLELVNPQGGA